MPETAPSDSTVHHLFAMATGQCIAFASFLALVFSGVRYKPSAETPKVVTEADIVVVGGGSGGSVVAGRLSEVTKWQVVLLEAGPEEPVLQQVPAFGYQTLSSSVYDWQLKVQSSPNDHTGSIPRGKMLGGCSAHNAMLYVRGLESDHQCWVKSGASGWSFKDVLPFYKKSENAVASLAKDKTHHSTGGVLDVGFTAEDRNVQYLRSAFKQGGYSEIDLNGGKAEGFSWAALTSHGGQRRSANMAFLEGPRKTRKNLHVYTEAHVKKVHINAKTKRAEAVEYTDKKGVTHVIKARLEVVLSAGTYFSPQLLMVSGVGPKEQLQKAKIPVIADLPGVGKNLQDHVLSSSLPTLTFTKTAIVPTVADLQKAAKDFAKGTGPLTIRGLSPFVARRRSPSQPKNDQRPYIQIGPSVQWAKNSRIPYCAEKKPVDNRTVCYYDQASVHTVLLHSTDAGSVQLNTTDPFSTPFIYQKIFTSTQDVRAMAAGLKQTTDLLVASKALKKAGIQVTLPSNGAACGKDKIGTQAYYECLVRANGGSSWGHGTGTCSIGSVVDSRLRVLGGIKGLRVADASVMPCVTSGNTNAPTIMIGERAADFIKKDHKV